MNRLSKAIFITLAGLVVLAAVAVVGANLYIQSPGTQMRIQAELSKALRIPLRITSTTITPWGGLHMSGISVPPEEGTFLEAKSFDADYGVLALLRGHLLLTKMTLESPRLVWTQSADGKWRLPALPKPAEKADKPRTSHEPHEKSDTVSFDNIKITNGTIEFADLNQKRIAAATDVNMTCIIGQADTAEGSLKIGRLSLQDSFNFTEVSSAVRYADGHLSFTDLHGSLAGGTTEGSITMQLQGEQDPMEVALTFDRVDLARFTTEANWQPGQSAGRLSGSATLHGSLHKMESLEGTGRLNLADGQFNQLQLFQMIGLILQIPELSDLHFKTVAADFHLANEHTYIDRLLLETPDLQLTAKGNVRFDGRISMNARLEVSKRLTEALPTLVTDSLTPPDPKGSRAIEFEISGRTDKPKTNLKEKVFSHQTVTSQLNELLSSVFGGDPKKKKDKDKEKDARKKDGKKGAADAPPNAPENSASDKAATSAESIPPAAAQPAPPAADAPPQAKEQ